tara:strand:+ start:7512 stop:9176 length:1665 start_codon:yes stop_codon:yes gene_type:complete
VALFSVHYSYDGSYSVLGESSYQEAENLSYAYPYYSDEWYAVAFSNFSIDTKSLPVFNPFDEGSYFINFEYVFHVLIAHMLLFLGLNPVTQYTILSVGINTSLIVLTYILAFILSRNKLSAGFAAASLLFITHGANLPTLWSLIPINVGIIFLLATIIFLVKDRYKIFFILNYLTLLFYPPLIVFLLPLYVYKFYTLRGSQYFLTFPLQVLIGAFFAFVALTSAYIFTPDVIGSYITGSLMFLYSVMVSFMFSSFSKRIQKLNVLRKISIEKKQLPPFLFLGLIAVVPFILNISATKHFVNMVSSFIYYETFTPLSIPLYAPQNIIPMGALLLSIIGAYCLYKQKKIEILAAILSGILFWVVYSLTFHRLIIEYQRVVFTTSVLVIIISACGITQLLNTKILKKVPPMIIGGLFFVSLFLLLLGFTEREKWKELVLVNKGSEQSYLPAAPANRYLHPDDLRIFSSLEKERFLSHQWKGTVIGVATGNIPLETKPGTISTNVGLSQAFQQGNCGAKASIVRTFNISYLYFPEIPCPGYELVDTSQEGFNLYKTSL